MYKKFYGVQVNPFNINPDPRFLYLTRGIRETLACLAYGVQERKGFVLLTGEVGTGKTTLLNKFLEWLRKNNIATAFIFNSSLNTNEFLEFALTDFGIPIEANASKTKVLMRLNQWLLEQYRARRVPVLIVDEAQNLSPEVLEEIRLLTNLETSTEKLLQIVLSGQPELEYKLKQPALRQLWQRITLRCKTRPFTLEETDQYIAQRLRIAGANGTPVFSPAAVQTVFRYAQGIPRVTNLLCEHAMISGFVDQLRPIGPEIIETIAREFELDQIPPVVDERSASGENAGLAQALRAVSAAPKPARVEAMPVKQPLQVKEKTV